MCIHIYKPAQFKRSERGEIQINVLQVTHAQMYMQIVTLAIFSVYWEGNFYLLKLQNNSVSLRVVFMETHSLIPQY